VSGQRAANTAAAPAKPPRPRPVGLASRRLGLIAGACVLPRLAVLLYERGSILASFTEKSDDFARTFVDSGTYGFVPGLPSAWTQPLYGWFLIPIYWIFGRSWWAVGPIQILAAMATAFLVYEIGRRFVSARVGLAAALISTLNPYLIWHDVHLNREILDQLLAAAIVLLGMLAAERRSIWLAGALGTVAGLAILGNSRLTFVPLLLIAFLAWRRRAWRPAMVASAALVGACVLVILPWPIRNDVQVGCFTLTTDTRALWKANNENTYRVLAHGGWIDDVPPLPGAPLTPEQAADYWKTQHRKIRVDECAQMRLYRHLVWVYWRDHPGGKLKLAAQAAGMFWSPRQTKTEGRSEQGTTVDTLRSWAEPAYVIPLYILALAGVARVPRRLAVLVGGLLAYQTVAAMAFAGATRYRSPWESTIALFAGAGLVGLSERLLPLGGALRRRSASTG
jgi:4-amino-4-deoxy-L-arabinose transferase-like glycosyltransferase